MSLHSFRVALRRTVAYQRCRRFMSANLLLVNTGTCCTLYTLGDVIQQRLEGNSAHDWPRSMRMAVLGLCMGPINHYWYAALDRLIRGPRSLQIVGKKVVADQLVMAPICSSVFYIGMCLLEGRRKEQIVDELRVKFWPTYKMDWQLWPAAQVLNFYFVPSTLRVTYVNVVTLVWTVYLSYMKHKDVQRKQGMKSSDVQSQTHSEYRIRSQTEQ